MPGTVVVNNLKVVGDFSANISLPASLPDGTLTGDYLYWDATAGAWTVGRYDGGAKLRLT